MASILYIVPTKKNMNLPDIKIPFQQEKGKASLQLSADTLNSSYQLLDYKQNYIKYSHDTCGHVIEKTFPQFRAHPKCNNEACMVARHKERIAKKYGVENISQIREVKDKKKAKSMEKYGTTSVLASKEIKEKIKKTNLDKYGSENVFGSEYGKEKIKEHNLRTYGVEHSLQAPEIREKIGKTNINKYGVKNPFENEEIKEKIKKTNVTKYGFENPAQSDEIKEKKIQTSLTRYGVKNPAQRLEARKKSSEKLIKNYLPTLLKILNKRDYELLEEYKGKYDELGKYIQYEVRHLKCGHIFYDDVGLIPRCPKCFNSPNISQQEKFYYEYIKSLNVDVEENNRTILDGKEIDIYLPNHKIGFEFNGIYYHNADRKSKTYHQEKTNLAESKGIKLYHIWEFMNIDIICSKINVLLHKNVTKLYARELEIKDVSLSEEKEFLNKTHLYGYVPSHTCKGLYDTNGILISLMSLRRNTEIARAATELNTVVVGGFSKLLKSIKKDNLFTYADRDWSPSANNAVYNKLGLSLIGDSGPSLFYSDGKQVWSRQKFQKHKLEKLFPDIWDNALKANQILSIKGIYPFYTSGNWKFGKSSNCSCTGE